VAAVEAIPVYGDATDTRLVAFISAIPAASGTGLGSTIYVNLRDPVPEESARLRAALRETLAPYMVPDTFVQLENLPLSSSGKTDRKRLREIGAGLLQEQYAMYSALGQVSFVSKTEKVKYIPNVSENELVIKGLWSRVLELPADSISLEDNFLAIGGNSIKAMQLVAAARK
jgi:hypothetical protein